MGANPPQSVAALAHPGHGLFTATTIAHATSSVKVQAALVTQGVSRMQHSLLISRQALPPDVKVSTGVVLGYALQRDGTPTATLRQRVEVGTRLFEKGNISSLIFSGGHPGDGLRSISEAEAMQQYALSLMRRTSVPDRWFLESESTSTHENAVFSLHIMAAHGLRSVAVVTSRFHQLRSQLTFECAARQEDAATRPTAIYMAEAPPDQDRQGGFLGEALAELLRQVDFYRELAALMWYWFRGWLC
ncbi:hypothetical protein WJX72_003312 [[Myrmecia] bisecta]|uniref:DUF218 domain-containing protein n=1 Tax=[Myrmecia] bisecta TaxID=41462 RepID=A0AAW1Q6V8_9CHLO